MKGSRIVGLLDGKSEEELCRWTDSLALQSVVRKVSARLPYRFVRLLLPSDSIALGELSFYTGRRTDRECEDNYSDESYRKE